ncbi:MAG: MATE family efflux transporter, partial [Oscillospiraceae bacterium]
MTKEKTQGLTDMTVGSATKHIVRFAIPLLIGNMFQQLYNMVDSIVVGRFVGKTALAAVGTAFPVIFLLSSLFMGLGIGAMVMVSQYYGAGDNAKMKATVDTIYTGLMIGVVPLSLFGIFISGPVLHLLNVPPDTYGESHIYMLIVLGGLIGTLGYNANAGILQGLG